MAGEPTLGIVESSTLTECNDEVLNLEGDTICSQSKTLSQVIECDASKTLFEMKLKDEVSLLIVADVILLIHSVER